MIGEEISTRCEEDFILKQFFGGVIGLEKLKSIKKLSKCVFFITNVDKSSKIGSHWFTVFRIARNHYELFDSLGVSEAIAKDRLGKNAGTCFFNTARFQAPDSKSCGKFAVFFAFVRLSNFDESFHEVIETYFKVDDWTWNEKCVEAWWTSGELTSVLD